MRDALTVALLLLPVAFAGCVQDPAPVEEDAIAFLAQPSEGPIPFSALFNLTGASDPGSPGPFTLDFGDGTKPAAIDASPASVAHTYYSIGSFTAKLSGASGSEIARATIVTTAPQALSKPDGSIRSTYEFYLQLPVDHVFIPTQATSDQTGGSPQFPAGQAADVFSRYTQSDSHEIDAETKGHLFLFTDDGELVGDGAKFSYSGDEPGGVWYGVRGWRIPSEKGFFYAAYQLEVDGASYWVAANDHAGLFKFEVV